MALTAEEFYISGLRSLARKTVHECVPCRRTNATPCTQQMGQLPADRICPAPPFQNVRIDYAGLLILNRGNPRKPTNHKANVAVFVCAVTKAIHLELVCDLSTEAFF